MLGAPPYDQMSIAASEGEPELLERKIRLCCWRRWSGQLRMQVCPYTVSTRQSKPCLLFRACRYSSGLSGEAYVAWGDAATTLHYGITVGYSG